MTITPTISPDKGALEKRANTLLVRAQDLEKEIHDLSQCLPGPMEDARQTMEDVVSLISQATDELEDDRTYRDTWGHEKETNW